MKWKKGEPQNRKIETLADKIRGVAYESIENLWNAFLDLEGLDMVRAMEKDPRLLVSHGNYIGAMKVLEGIYALVEISPYQRISPTVSSTLPWHRCSWRNIWQRVRTSSLPQAWMMCWHFSQVKSRKFLVGHRLTLHSRCAATSAAYGYDYKLKKRR